MRIQDRTGCYSKVTVSENPDGTEWIIINGLT